MKYIEIESSGSYDKLLIKEKDTPPPRDDEVLIETKATGVNFADCCVRMGVYRPAKVFQGWPITPGFEVTGIVKKVGTNVAHVSQGQRVVALTRFGGYTTHLLVKANQAFALPDNISFIEGAAFAVNFLTASYALNTLANPKPNQTLLVHSAAGGVGSALVQLGKLAKCTIVSVVGAPHKVQAVKALGANAVIDKSSQNLWDTAKRICKNGYDAIFDANGAETLYQSYQHLKPGGRLIIYGFHSMLSKGRGTPNWFKVIWHALLTPRFNPLNMTEENRSVMAFNLSYLFGENPQLKKEMEELIVLFEKGLLHFPKITTYPLEDVKEAHQALESGQTIGKIVLIS